jgi:3-deoxy-D-arabino-heptulosonate 7-phosphate (DAHP) synthase
MASVDEWLAAADALLARGNHRVALCERGIRTFERATLSTLDFAAVPLLRERVHLPVLVDPISAIGHTRWALPLAESACVLGAQGLLLPVALGDVPVGAGLSLSDFAALVARLDVARG